VNSDHSIIQRTSRLCEVSYLTNTRVKHLPAGLSALSTPTTSHTISLYIKHRLQRARRLSWRSGHYRSHRRPHDPSFHHPYHRRSILATARITTTQCQKIISILRPHAECVSEGRVPSGAPLRYPFCPPIAPPLIAPISAMFTPQIPKPSTFTGSTEKSKMGSFNIGGDTTGARTKTE